MVDESGPREADLLAEYLAIHDAVRRFGAEPEPGLEDLALALVRGARARVMPKALKEPREIRWGNRTQGEEAPGSLRGVGHG